MSAGYDLEASFDVTLAGLRPPLVSHAIRLRRLGTALVAVIAFMASRVESMLPEIHDGDAITAQLVAPMHEAPHSLALGCIAAASTNGASTQGSSPEHAPASHRGPHVDHCGHGHGAASPRETAPTPTLMHDHVPVGVEAVLASVVLPPQSRPPIL